MAREEHTTNPTHGSNESYTRIIDEFSAAVAALASDAPPETVERVGRALGNLLEALANRASAQSAGAFASAYAELKRDIAQINQRAKRRQTKEADTRTIVEDHQARIESLERHVGGHNGDHE